MFTLDERLRGLPALKEQVVSLHQSLNQPHLAIPGRRAGNSVAFVVGLRGPSGFAVFVYLYLLDSGECAVYVPSAGTVAAERFAAEEGEALGFVESMGFIMDNLNFRNRPVEEQDGMIRSFPVFQREPPPPTAHAATHAGSAATANAAGKPPPSPQGHAASRANLSTLGKLFAAFCLALLASCAHVITEKDKDQAQIRYDLAVQALVKEPQVAYREVEQALALNPGMAEAHHVKALLLHRSFGRLDDALNSYAKALELKPALSEAHTNLGNLYMDLKRYDDAIREYDMALGDVLYTAHYIAHGNRAWASFKKGDTAAAIQGLKASLSLNEKYCLGYAQLGQVYEEKGDAAEACKQFTRYRERCPEAWDAYEREGLCQAKAGQRDEAKKSFDQCVLKAPNDDAKERCQKLKEQS